MNCNIIKDLLPSYIDKICSEDTVKAVEEHIQHCEECKQTLKKMQQQTDFVQTIPEEVKKAIKPLKKINKKRRIQVIAAIVMTFMITVVGGFVIEEVEPVRQIFFPIIRADVFVDIEDMEEWQSIYFNDKKYMIFDSVFWKKEIINSAGNGSNILLRVKDENGQIVVDELKISPGRSVKLDSLKRGEKYHFEFKTKQKRTFINVI